MIIIAIGSNLISSKYKSSIDACEASIDMMLDHKITLVDKSSWYISEPIPVSSQPNFINGVILINTILNSHDLLIKLKAIETQMGRIRSTKNANRIIDLDIISYNDEITETNLLTLPHPRLADRAFVLMPISELVPDWRHPLTNISINTMLKQVKEQRITKI
jgi:2-amino-4-hydroxy-6-hydroxymethyldihydropteridine diphosphokinase